MHNGLERCVVIVALFCCAILSRAQSPDSTAPPPDLDSYVTASMKTFDVPGIAVAIVKDGKIVVVKG